jgi:hypothetical protein
VQYPLLGELCGLSLLASLTFLVIFDLGAALFQEPRRPAPQSWWNEVGFWSLSRRNPLAQVPPGVSVVPWSLWLGIPSWVPVLLTAVLPAVWWRRRRQK